MKENEFWKSEDVKPEKAETAEEYLIRRVCELERQNKVLEDRITNLTDSFAQEREHLFAIVSALGLKVTEDGYLYANRLSGYGRDNDTLDAIQYLRSIGRTDEKDRGEKDDTDGKDGGEE